MRGVALASAGAALAVVAAACSPEIGPGTYFCGPEEYCPPDLECDPDTFTCDLPSAVQPFSCPTGGQVREPDDSMDAAFSLGSIACGQSAIENGVGCIADGTDEDYLAITLDHDCSGDDPHLDVRVSFPVALVPLEVTILDDTGAEVAQGELCTTSPNYSGRDTLCLELRPEQGTYYVRVRPADHGDCGGDCRFNEYLIDVRHRLA